MRLCVIGNSHVAAIKQGWDEIGAEFPWLEPQFFGARGDALLDLHAQGDRLVPAHDDLAGKLAHTSGGETSIDPSRFDAALLVGMNYIPPMPADARLSQAVRAAAARAAFDETLAGHVFAQLRQAAPALPVHVLPNPLRRKAAKAKGDPVAVVPYAVRLADFRLGLGAGPVHVAGQPTETIVDDLYTADRYGIGAIALDQGRGARAKDEDDVSHMNAEYGTLVLRRWLPTLAPAA